jgi:hypothetical protein
VGIVGRSARAEALLSRLHRRCRRLRWTDGEDVHRVHPSTPSRDCAGCSAPCLEARRPLTHECMSARRLFAAAVTTYGLGFLAWLLSHRFRESFIGGLVGIPPFSIYVFEHFGVPGLTDRSDCNWMWCKPTVLGIVVATVFWLGVAWLVSVGIARLIRSARGHSAPPPGPAD